MKKKSTGILIIVILLVVAAALVYSFYAVNSVNKQTAAAVALTVQQDYDSLIKNEVQTAVSMLQGLYDKYQKGEISLTSAKRMGADLLRGLRYGPAHQGYFWADTVDGVNVVLYGDKTVEGKSRLNANINGVPYVKLIIANGKQTGGGYTDYYFTKLNSADLTKKRSYSLLFKPFNWVVGTGYYLDDLKSQMVN